MEADVAMYASKAEGQNRLHVFEPGLLLVRRLRSQLLDDLRAAIKGEGLVLHYQPVVELDSGRIEGVGLVVAGGSATGAGIEVLGPTATSFASVGFPSDPTVGAGAVLVAALAAVLVGLLILGPPLWAQLASLFTDN